MSARRRGTRCENTGEEATPCQESIEVFVDDLFTATGAAEGRPYAPQNEEIGDANDQQKQRGYAGSDHASDIVESVELALHSRRRRSNNDRGEDDDGRVPERKEETY